MTPHKKLFAVVLAVLIGGALALFLNPKFQNEKHQGDDSSISKNHAGAARVAPLIKNMQAQINSADWQAAERTETELSRLGPEAVLLIAQQLLQSKDQDSAAIALR